MVWYLFKIIRQDIFNSFYVKTKITNKTGYLTGHRERGFGLYQALMELNFNTPDQIPENYSLENRIAIFEQFWDCAAPRFGDQGSVGWKTFLRNKSISSASESVSDGAEDRLISEAGGRVAEAKLWLAIEQHRFVIHITFAT